MRSIITMLSVTLFSFAVNSNAQDINDAYNFSNTNSQGTARSIGFGSALGSIGGDFSSLSVNPAGIGVYRTSEVAFTPSIKAASSTSQYLNVASDDNNTRFNINNLSVVFTNAPKGKRYERRDWKSVSFAFGLNRIADFNRDYNYQGINYSSSAAQSFEADANAFLDAPYSPGTLGNIGYTSHLIDSLSGSEYVLNVPYQGGIQQVNTIKERGRINEFAISFGGNYKEKLLLGATLGIDGLRYTRESNYTENIIASNTTNPSKFQSFTYNNDTKTNGTGVNLKIGAIYKVADFLRIGASLHSPTIYNLHQTLDYGISSNIGNNRYNYSTGNYFPQSSFDYTLITPLKSVLSIAFLLKKVGFITADYEYVSYNTMRFRFPAGMDNSSGYSYSYLAEAYNKAIRNDYKGTSNFRLGSEIKITKFFMVRGGFGYYGNPYKNSPLQQRIDISGGVGFRTGHFFADFGFVNSTFQSAENAYSFNYDYVHGNPTAFPVATTDFSVNNIAFTVGTKF